MHFPPFPHTEKYVCLIASVLSSPVWRQNLRPRLIAGKHERWHSQKAFQSSLCSSDCPREVPSAIEIPWILYAGHGGPRKPHLRLFWGPVRAQFPRKSCGSHAGSVDHLYNPTVLRHRSLHRACSRLLPFTTLPPNLTIF